MGVSDLIEKDIAYNGVQAENSIPAEYKILLSVIVFR